MNGNPRDFLTRRRLLGAAAACFAAVQVGAAIGAPPLGPCDPADQKCLDQQRAEAAGNEAREYLNLGDAALAVGDMPNAIFFWQRALDIGKPYGAQAAIIAQKRLQMHTLTCSMTPESIRAMKDSLAAISRDHRAHQGDLIHVRVLQRALKALGYYNGPLTGELGRLTRAAIGRFQSAMAFSETEALAPYQIVYLICNAAETANDPASQTTLGIMYATGLGVRQNIDFALEWLRTASRRGYPDATYNLSILYGTGLIFGSYRLCDFPYSPEQADQYLKEACEQGHPIAIALAKLYGVASPHGRKSARERWALIETHQLEKSKADKTGLYAGRLASVGTKCGPDRSIK